MESLIKAAKGEIPCDLVLKRAQIVNTFTGEIERGNVGIHLGMVAGIGDYEGIAEEDLQGSYLSPAFIDGHVHLESSMLDVFQYARAVVPRGTLAVVTDLHEIANVAGLAGMKYVLDSARELPLDVFLMAPSCVPATALETSGAELTASDIEEAMRWPETTGLGEMMNFPGVLAADYSVLAKIKSAGNRAKDGHAPGLTGKMLNAYIAAGPASDHESTDYDEGKEKLRRGMRLMIRQSSSEKNLEDLLPLVNDETARRCFFVVDDRGASELLNEGDVDSIIRKAIQRGLSPLRAIQMATLNTAEYFKLDKYGAVAPGFYANLVVLSDLGNLKIDSVYYKGSRVAEAGRPVFKYSPSVPPALTSTFRIKPFSREDLVMPARLRGHPVIEVVPGQILTRKVFLEPKISGNQIVPDAENDILEAAVVERHRASGNIGLGLVKGFGLKRGAIASSVAHDSHNIVAVGAGIEDLYLAIREVERLQGGLTVVADGQVRVSLALPIAGLLSTEPLEVVADLLGHLEEAVRSLGSKLPAPFAVLSFLALPVIPELRLTDKGLVDVNAFKILD